MLSKKEIGVDYNDKALVISYDNDHKRGARSIELAITSKRLCDSVGPTAIHHIAAHGENLEEAYVNLCRIVYYTTAAMADFYLKLESKQIGDKIQMKGVRNFRPSGDDFLNITDIKYDDVYGTITPSPYIINRLKSEYPYKIHKHDTPEFKKMMTYSRG